MNDLSHVLRVLALAGGLALGSAPACAEPPVSEQVIAQVRQVLTPKDAAGRVKLVRGLRALKDPALAPFFTQMGTAKSPVLRAEAGLALAEIEPSKGLDLLPVRKLDPVVQAYVLAEAIEAGLLKNEQLEDLARWPDLQPGLYVSIAGRLVAAQRRVDPARLRQVMAGNDPIVSTVAGILLKQMGQGENISAGGDKLLATKAPGAADAVRRVLTVVRERKFSAGAEFARKALEQSGSDRLLRFEAVRTLLVIEPSGDRAAQLLAAELASAPDAAERSRLGLAAATAAIERESGIPAAVVETLKRQDDRGVAQLGEALGAIAAKSDATTVLSRLVQRRSGPLTAWVLAAAKKLAPEAARAVRVSVVNAALDGDAPDVEALALEAAQSLAHDHPDLLRAPLLEAIDRRDDKTAGRILAAAIRSGNPHAVDLADVARSMGEPNDAGSERPLWPTPAVGAVATLLRARYAEKPTPQQVEQLAKVATGSGGLPEPVRMQAAWLALKGATDDRAALARMLAEMEGE